MVVLPLNECLEKKTDSRSNWVVMNDGEERSCCSESAQRRKTPNNLAGWLDQQKSFKVTGHVIA